MDVVMDEVLNGEWNLGTKFSNFKLDWDFNNVRVMDSDWLGII